MDCPHLLLAPADRRGTLWHRIPVQRVLSRNSGSRFCLREAGCPGNHGGDRGRISGLCGCVSRNGGILLLVTYGRSYPSLGVGPQPLGDNGLCLCHGRGHVLCNGTGRAHAVSCPSLFLSSFASYLFLSVDEGYNVSRNDSARCTILNSEI